MDSDVSPRHTGSTMRSLNQRWTQRLGYSGGLGFFHNRGLIHRIRKGQIVLIVIALLTGVGVSSPVLANQTPDCSGGIASPSTLWPANHKFQSIDILGVFDAEGDQLEFAVQCIQQDEPLDSTGDGNTDWDAQDEDAGDATVQLRAERQGNGNGRVYHISYSVSDTLGARCIGRAHVGVPKSKKSVPVDDGPLHKSKTPII